MAPALLFPEISPDLCDAPLTALRPAVALPGLPPRVALIEKNGYPYLLLSLGYSNITAASCIIVPFNMDDLEKRIANLSPAGRKLLEQRLAQINEQRSIEQGIPRQTWSGPAPLSYGQQRVWFVDNLLADIPLYNQSTLFQIRGHLAIDVLRQALDDLILRHEILRTTFHLQENGALVQIVSKEYQLDLPTIDVSDAADPYEQAIRCAGVASDRLFDLSRDLMLRAELYTLGPESYILALTKHHIASDHGSTSLMCRELGLMYNARLIGDRAILDPLPITYADFAAWQREHYTDAHLQEQLAYWRDNLPDPPPVLSLIPDKPRTVQQSHRCVYHEQTLSPELVADLWQLATAEGATRYMLILAAYSILLYRYTRQNEIIIGTMLSGRTRREIGSLFGLFIELLPLYMELSPAQSFRDFLRQVRSTTLDAYDHRDCPYEKLVEELQMDRDLKRTPLFQTYLNYLNEPRVNLLLEGLEVTRINRKSDYSEFEIFLTIFPEPEQLTISIAGSEDVYGHETLQRMVEHLRVLLRSIVEQPDQAIGLLPLMNVAEEQRILVDWTQTQKPFLPVECIHRLFEKEAARTPEAAAILFEGQTLSYAELNDRANRLAHFLRKDGVGPEHIVAISLDRGPDFIIGILGILKAGAAFLPLDPSYPPERLGFMLADARSSILVTAQRVSRSFPHFDGRIIYLDSGWPQIETESHENLPDIANPNNAAYVIYTSGSTGLPKGTVLQHDGLHNLSISQRHTYGIETGTRILQFASISFDVSIWEIFMALANGGTLCIAREEVLKSPSKLHALLRDQKINIINLTPTMLAEMEEYAASPLPDLQIVCAVGEECPLDLVRLWAPGRRFYNAYGPTETTVIATIGLCDAGDPRPPSIGRPIDNARVYILDEQMNPVPIGVPGDLYISGILVGREYLNRPQLTRESFIPDPFNENGRVTMYRSGDTARWREDGTIEFLGRGDLQVKFHGHRIELNEIQYNLGRYAEIRQCVVTLAKGEDGDQQLVAYYVPHHTKIPPVLLRNHLSRSLPSYMVPSHFVPLDTFPQTPSGKIDRRSLPDVDILHKPPVAEYTPPRTSEEEILCDLWAGLLKLEKVGVNDNFFDLGGHSIVAIRIVHQTSLLFNTEVYIRWLFEQPTIAELVKLLPPLPDYES